MASGQMCRISKFCVRSDFFPSGHHHPSSGFDPPPSLVHGARTFQERSMKFRRKILNQALPVAALLGLALMTSQARAISLTPGSSGAPTGVALPSIGGGPGELTLLASSGPLAFSTGPSGVIGTLVAQVLKDNDTGLLTFTYEVTNDGPTGGEHLTRLSSTRFTGTTTDVDYDPTLGGSVVPTTVDRNTAQTVGFNFNIGPSASSKLLYIRTDATKFYSGTTFIQNGGQAVLTTFSPVPEPATMALAFSALPILGIGYLRRRNHRDA